MQFQYENAYDVKERIRSKRAAILPIGAVEAHGPHLPLGTDNVLAERLAAKLAERTDSYLLPTLPYGQVWSLRSFPGSLSVSNEALVLLLCDIGESLHRQGFRVFAMVNGHLGNGTALKEAARRLAESVPELKVYHFFYPGSKDTIARVRESPPVHGAYFHACEIETSYMLYLAGELVDMDKAICDIPNIGDEADCTPTPWETFTETAVLGDATLATKEKGEAIVEASLAVMAEMVNRAKERASG
ncbi:creatininase family protein [Paenibacillus flagellatus]|uniref:Creatinine amidohydrolase n=1 Tax=Paenibacillus flagellatus TaxID=2211139 RepID=A0A2V5JYY4_9BACL|nr:creatininase family protein [Paenibacillus flagellatus]PYI51502.1 creatinine amidohydrolase [Paenibacillus flagellatus]